jgi:hypothetical protein
MKWEVIITTDLGKKLTLPLNGYYKTKKDAEQVAQQAATVKGTVSVQIAKHN